MDFISVPLIVICCYICGEIYKVIFKKKQKAYKLIPLLVTLLGGVLGVAIYLTNPEMIFNVSNVWMSLEIGLLSGASSTGSNQLIKQLIKGGSSINE